MVNGESELHAKDTPTWPLNNQGFLIDNKALSWIPERAVTAVSRLEPPDYEATRSAC